MPVARDGIARSWWVEVAPEMGASERAWLIRHVYGAHTPAPIVARRVDALSRWRADPADCAVAHAIASTFARRTSIALARLTHRPQAGAGTECLLRGAGVPAGDAARVLR